MADTNATPHDAAGEIDSAVSYEEQLESWELSARHAFVQDGGARLLSDIERFELPVSAEEMFDASISLVLACAGFHQDDPKLADFLARQALNDQASQEASYRLLFELHSRQVGVVVADRDLRLLDLAELYDYPLLPDGSLGFTGFWVVRPDGLALEPGEIVALEEAITRDIRFDYCDEEVCIDFDESWPGALHCTVRDYSEED